MIVLAAACAALATFVFMRPASRRLLAPAPRRPSLSLTRPVVVRAASAVVGLVLALTWGGLLGFVFGAGVAVAIPIAIGRLESRSVRERREGLDRQSAACADLLSACLASGASLSSSAAAVAEALGPPVDGPLRSLVDALDLGAHESSAWRAIGAQPALSALARAAARSADSGAPLGRVLAGIADDLRRDTRSRADAAARAAGVKAVAPLAVCFLPAFLLIGVVPVVVSLALPLVSGTLGTS